MDVTFNMIRTMAQYPAIRNAFEALFVYDPENPRFLFDLADYKRSPSQADADRLMGTYISAGSPDQVNLPYAMRHAIELSAAALTPPAFAAAGRNVRQLFDPAADEVLMLINTNRPRVGPKDQVDEFFNTYRICG